ncbi:low molecular weight phosphotyrosine protein phosphatase [Rubripirellula amarantea]|nr:low molecular weight phosphotyrosine protein phosphatase [Rubripirellula amarantea]
MTKKVLFVCMGNICRSPAGEAVMQRFADEFGADVEVDSAGTHGYHVGERADVRMRTASESRGYELKSIARKVEPSDLQRERFDLVLAMDSENHAILVEMAGGIKPHIRMFSDYLDDTWPTDVPDPYYGEEDGFGEVLDMLEEGCPVILETLIGEDLFAGEFDEDQ